MAVILQFRRDVPRSENQYQSSINRQSNADGPIGEVILFPGVRIERHAGHVHHVIPAYEMPEDVYDSFLYDDYYEPETVDEEYADTDIFFDSHS